GAWPACPQDQDECRSRCAWLAARDQGLEVSSNAPGLATALSPPATRWRAPRWARLLVDGCGGARAGLHGVGRGALALALARKLHRFAVDFDCRVSADRSG